MYVRGSRPGPFFSVSSSVPLTSDHVQADAADHDAADRLPGRRASRRYAARLGGDLRARSAGEVACGCDAHGVVRGELAGRALREPRCSQCV